MPTHHDLNVSRQRGRSMKRRLAAGVTASALVLGFAAAAQASGQSPLGLNSITVFGDSMSDSGSYASQAPAGAGKFTTNPDNNWVGDVQVGLGLPTLTAHAAGGSNWAEGGARVVDIFGAGLPPGVGDGLPGNFSRTPVVTQVDNYFAAGGGFNANSLVIIQGGGNDVFSALANGPAYTTADMQRLTTSANGLANQIKRLNDAGAGTVVTISVPQFDIYNQLYKAALAAGQPNVLYVDVAKLISEIQANPARYGITNITDKACNVGRVESFRCTPALYVTPNANQTYLFADGAHFTGAVQAMEGEITLADLLAPGAISQLPYMTQSAAQGQSQAFGAQMDRFRAAAPGTWSPFASVSFDDVQIDSSAQRIGVRSDTGSALVGTSYALSPTTSLGAALSWSKLNGNLDEHFDAQAYGFGLMGRKDLGPAKLWAEADYNHLDFNDINRVIPIGPTQYNEHGSTTGEQFALSGGVSGDRVLGPLRATPSLGLRYDHTRLAGYSEHGSDSAQMSFGSQKLEELTASVGLKLSLADADDALLRPYVEVAYNDDLLDKDRHITVVASGAPVAWTTGGYKADGSYLTYGAGLTAKVSARVEAMAGVQATADRGSLNDTFGFVGLRSAF